MNINKEHILTYLLYYIYIGVVTYIIFVGLRYLLSKSYRHILQRQLYNVTAYLTKGDKRQAILFIVVYTFVITTLTWPITYLVHIKRAFKKFID